MYFKHESRCSGRLGPCRNRGRFLGFGGQAAALSYDASLQQVYVNSGLKRRLAIGGGQPEMGQVVVELGQAFGHFVQRDRIGA